MLQPQATREIEARAAPPLSVEMPAVAVEFTDNAKAALLRSEGFTVAEISTKLGLDEATINSYLNLGPKLGF
jgi:DNA-binding NarL/FixJ family response regulator